MTSPDLEFRIRKWLDMLANLVATGKEPVTVDRIADTAGMLAMDGLPAAAFCQGSLHATVQGQAWFPPYEHIRHTVTVWWDANRPRSVNVLPGAQTPGLDAVDQGWLAFFWRRRDEITEGGGDGADAALANLASLVRQQAPKAWAVISGRRGEPVRREPTEAELQAVAEALAPLVAGSARGRGGLPPAGAGRGAAA